MKIIFLFFLIVLSISLHSQKYTISGYVKDAQTGELLIGTNIYDKITQNGTTTNAFGFYSLTLNSDTVELVFSFIGYHLESQKMFLSENIEITKELNYSIEIQEVTITAEQQNRLNEISTVKINSQTVKALPSLIGENDLFKTLQLMPGIQTTDEGSSSLIIRGGSTDQNLILLDDVPLYYVNHLGSFMSVFNPYSIKSVKLIKGGFPAQYGGRLSSVLDIRTIDGNLKRTAGEIEIGLISEKFSLEGPIIKDKFSYFFSVRRSILDLFTTTLLPLFSENTRFGYNLFDINIKLYLIATKNSKLSLSFYKGVDNLFFKDINDFKYDYSESKTEAKWGNTIASLRWNYKYSEKLFGNLTFAVTNFKYFNSINSLYYQKDSLETVHNTESAKYVYYSQITDFNFKADYDYKLNNFYNLNFGSEAIYHIFEPGVISETLKKDDNKLDTIYSNFSQNTKEIAVYADNNFKISNKIIFNAGLRATVYFLKQKTYHSFEPRISLNYRISDRFNIKTSYAKTNQYLHLLSNNGTGTPADIWLPVTSSVPPQNAWQYTLGFFTVLTKHNIEFSAEFFYKDLKNLVEIKEGKSLLWSTEDWQTNIDTAGTGKIYGVELLIQKTNGKLNGWIAYTWSKNTRQFQNQNQGQIYNYIYDRPHNISIVAMYKLNKKISFSANWVYMSGKSITFAKGNYHYLLPSFESTFFNILIYDEKNNFRMPPVHHLDLSVSFEKQIKHGLRIWKISIYNIYNRKNAYMYYYDGIKENDKKKIVLKKFTLFPIIPTISYSLKF